MGNVSHHGAAVLAALLPILPLAMVLRRRGGGRDVMLAGAASLALLVIGAGVALGSGTP